MDNNCMSILLSCQICQKNNIKKHYKLRKKCFLVADESYHGNSYKLPADYQCEKEKLETVGKT